MNKEPQHRVSGSVYIVGDNVDTDQIIPAMYLNLVPTIEAEYRELGSHAMSGLPEGELPFIATGAVRSEHIIMIAGKNFGCGSSREHAPIALGAAGIAAVVAESYARIFFRNAVATGELYPMESEIALSDAFKTGDRVTLDIDTLLLIKESSGEEFALKPLGSVAPVIAAGGIFSYARQAGMVNQSNGQAESV